MARTQIIILFCLIFFAEAIFPDIELSDIGSVPELWTHYQEHRSQTPDITFLSFLLLHYGESDHLAQDAQSHKKLPFRNHHHHFVIYQVVDNSFVADVSHAYHFLMIIDGVAYSEHPLYSISRAIWQPPRA